mmetsp:Transcript_41848/g.100864  ORF Transcript_41848/g.100864 Transcript_41848/m.100864 type:complete len:220 (+) Transcript_41848:1182-1841(+)
MICALILNATASLWKLKKLRVALYQAIARRANTRRKLDHQDNHSYMQAIRERVHNLVLQQVGGGEKETYDVDDALVMARAIQEIRDGVNGRNGVSYIQQYYLNTNLLLPAALTDNELVFLCRFKIVDPALRVHAVAGILKTLFGNLASDKFLKVPNSVWIDSLCRHLVVDIVLEGSLRPLSQQTESESCSSQSGESETEPKLNTNTSSRFEIHQAMHHI